MEEVSDVDIAYDKISEDLQRLAAWVVQWRATFNASKTVYMHISLCSHEQHPNLYLKEANNHTHLGLTLNNKLNWDDHIDRISNMC